MANLNSIKKLIIGLFPKGALKDTIWEYNFKFDFDKEIKTIAYSTNLTPFTIGKAIENKADLLITHHDVWPFMNKPKDYCNKLLSDNKLNHCFVHTPLDAAPFGTSASLAKELGLTNTKFTAPYHNHLVGVAGQTKKQTFEVFIFQCEKVLNEKIRSFKNNDIMISKVLIVTGGGDEITLLDSAIQEKCDTYVTGEYSMYLQHYAEFHKINLIIGSHTKTEIIGVRNFVKKISEQFPDTKTIEIEEPSF